jgi:N-formylglutamate amidohydrolase
MSTKCSTAELSAHETLATSCPKNDWDGQSRAGEGVYNQSREGAQELLAIEFSLYGDFRKPRAEAPMSKHAFSVSMPENLTSPVVFASPHSGSDYDSTFLQASILDGQQIRSSEDAFVDQLFADVPRFGAPLLAAVKPRAFLDLNRATEELDPALIEDVPRRSQNPRVASGLGVIPRVVANGRAIYRGKLPRQEAHRRITQYWHPYHDALQGLLTQAQDKFGQAVLVDCHSMPHEAIATMPARHSALPEVVLGDRFGSSAAAAVMDRVEAAFVRAGLRVVRNAPFAGAYITQSYGRPSRGQHAVQVEIDRSLYMDEALVRPNGDFFAVKELLGQVAAEIALMDQDEMPLAAE